MKYWPCGSDGDRVLRASATFEARARCHVARSIAPESVTAADILEYGLDGEAIDPKGKTSYKERFIHSEIYRARPDVNAVVHCHTPSLIPFGVTKKPLRPMYHQSAFLAAGVPVFEIRDAGGMTNMLVETVVLGRALAKVLADKPAVLRECHRVLAPGGRLAFTDWVARPGLSDRERERLWEWMAATTLQTLESYRVLIGRAGFNAIDAEDLSEEWRPILRRRLAMYRALRVDTVARLGEQRYEEYDQLYAFFVGLVEDGKLGGGRFSASG